MHRRRGLTLAAALILAAEPSPAAEASETGRTPSPTGAAVCSLVLPGWGQLRLGKPVKAVIYSGFAEAFAYGIYKQHQLYRWFDRRGDHQTALFYRNDRNRLGWYLAATVILSSMDAFVDAHLAGFEVSPNLAGVPGAPPSVGVTLGMRR